VLWAPSESFITKWLNDQVTNDHVNKWPIDQVTKWRSSENRWIKIKYKYYKVTQCSTHDVVMQLNKKISATRWHKKILRPGDIKKSAHRWHKKNSATRWHKKKSAHRWHKKKVSNPQCFFTFFLILLWPGLFQPVLVTRQHSY
jgi:hypothetical protein